MGRKLPRPIGRVWIEDVDGSFFQLKDLKRLIVEEVLEAVTDAGINLGSTKYLYGDDVRLRIGSSPGAPPKRVYSINCWYGNYGDIRGLFSGSDMILRTYPSTSRHLLIQSYDGANKTCLDLVNGRVDIPLAGDIKLQTDRRFDAAIGAVRIGASAVATPAAGDMRFNPVTDVFECYNGTAWVGVTLT